jgi:hypothetical protein
MVYEISELQGDKKFAARRSLALGFGGSQRQQRKTAGKKI